MSPLGREKAAYEILKRIHHEDPGQRKPTLITTLQELEKKLDVPKAQRINIVDD